MAQKFTVEPLNQSLYAVVSAEGPESLRAIDVAIPTNRGWSPVFRILDFLWQPMVTVSMSAKEA